LSIVFATGYNLDLLQTYVQAHVAGSEVDELEHVGAHECLGHLDSRHVVRGKDEIRSSAAHFIGGSHIGDTGGKLQARIEAFGREHQEQIVRVGGQGGD